MTPEENQEDVPSPVRVYLNDGGMTVHLFYEGHPDHVTDTNIIDVTLYAVSDASGDVGRRRMDTPEKYCEAFGVGYTEAVSTKTCRSSRFMNLRRGLSLSRTTKYFLFRVAILRVRVM